MNENPAEVFPNEPELVRERAEHAAKRAAENIDPDLQVSAKLVDRSSKLESAPNTLVITFSRISDPKFHYVMSYDEGMFTAASETELDEDIKKMIELKAQEV